jgi:hypothetical protein
MYGYTFEQKTQNSYVFAALRNAMAMLCIFPDIT